MPTTTNTDQCRRLMNGLYLVKGEDGFRNGAAQAFKDHQSFTPGDLTDSPAEYPVVCEYRVDQFGKFNARTYPVDVYRTHLIRMLADLDRE